MPLSSKKSKQSRFPVARIKRIMQLDEEVGKLASATPVMISKSLECFLQLLLDETCKETRARGSKKMTAYHLKHMINTNETFDFLREIVEAVPDPVISEPKAGPSKRNVSGNTGDQQVAAAAAAAAGGPKKRGRKPATARGTEEEEQDLYANAPESQPPAGNLPSIGTWKRDMSGGGGTGEGGRGIFDDYEDDDDY